LNGLSKLVVVVSKNFGEPNGELGIAANAVEGSVGVDTYKHIVTVVPCKDTNMQLPDFGRPSHIVKYEIPRCRVAHISFHPVLAIRSISLPSNIFW
jgi:hypothetical protein